MDDTKPDPTNPDWLEYEVFAPIIGSIVLQWNRLERSVDLIDWRIRQQKRSPKAPGGMAEKVKLLRKHWSLVLRGGKQDQIERIADRIQDLASARNMLLHGYWHRIEPGEPPRILYRKSKFGLSEIAKEDRSFTPRQLIELWRQIRQLDRQLSIFVLVALTPKRREA